MGIKGSPTGLLVFEDMEVPAGNLFGEEGKGFIYAMQTLDTSRPVIAAQAVGIAQGALDEANKYAKERVQFGRPISTFQGISWMMADMAAQIEAGAQAAVLAPTETLADQHLRTLDELLAPAGIQPTLITGRVPRAERDRREVKSGEPLAISGIGRTKLAAPSCLLLIAWVGFLRRTAGRACS